nr:MAG TPA: hypothetical protein [Caudoviricetes sp.]
MERLTKHSKQTSHENGICCTHFRGPECLEVGGNCAMNCKWEEAAWSRLAAYEDTGWTPEEIEQVINVYGRGQALRTENALRLEAVKDISTDRLRELAEADKDGRLVVLPCKVGDKLYRVFDGNISEHEVQNMKYFARQRRLGIDMTPFFPDAGRFIGKTVFLTREEAEKELDEIRNGNGNL